MLRVGTCKLYVVCSVLCSVLCVTRSATEARLARLAHFLAAAQVNRAVMPRASASQVQVATTKCAVPKLVAAGDQPEEHPTVELFYIAVRTKRSAAMEAECVQRTIAAEV
jgi:hypothetical protein